MSRKLVAVGLVLVVTLGLTMADRVSSQDKGESAKDGKRGFADAFNPSNANLDQMLQELKKVRAQRADLDRREKDLIAAIMDRINAERQQLDQQIQERRKKLDEIERQLPADTRFRDAGEKKG
jgi:septal ring factor EnvC (AmiA/AmiB activator)